MTKFQVFRMKKVKSPQELSPPDFLPDTQLGDSVLVFPGGFTKDEWNLSVWSMRKSGVRISPILYRVLTGSPSLR